MLVRVANVLDLGYECWRRVVGVGGNEMEGMDGRNKRDGTRLARLSTTGGPLSILTKKISNPSVDGI